MNLIVNVHVAVVFFPGHGSEGHPMNSDTLSSSHTQYSNTATQRTDTMSSEGFVSGGDSLERNRDLAAVQRGNREAHG